MHASPIPIQNVELCCFVKITNDLYTLHFPLKSLMQLHCVSYREIGVGW